MELFDVKRTEDKVKNSPLVIDDNTFAIVQALKEIANELRKARVGTRG